ncbi:hypothetical protein ACHQM5_023998 [Ranunculus cassubicifolius]
MVLLHRLRSQPSLQHLYLSIFPFSRLHSSHFSTLIAKEPIKNCSHQHPHNLFHRLTLCQNINDLHKIHSLLDIHLSKKYENFIGEFIKVCFKLSSPEFALDFFSNLQKPTSWLQNVIIRCLTDYTLYDQVLNVYLRCRKLGCKSDNFTFPFVIKACTSICDFQTGEEVHCVVLKTGLQRFVVVQTSLIDMYAKSGYMNLAGLVFDEIPEPDLVSWNAVVSGYSFNGLDQQVFQVIRKIQEVGFMLNVSTFASLIPVCTRALGMGRSIHGFILKCGILLDEQLVPALISMYSSNGGLSVARGIFHLLDKKNVVTWNAMISGYTHNQMSIEAIELYRDMLDCNELPNLVTFVTIVPCSVGLDRFRYGESIHASGIKYGVAHQPAAIPALLSMYAKFGDIDSARFLFYGLGKRDLLSWNSMVSGYVQNGFPYESLSAFCEMQIAGLTPDSVSLLSVLSACTELKGFLMGMSAHAYCLRHGLDSSLNVLNALLTFYSECGKSSTFLALFNSMVTRNVVSWNILSSSCALKTDITNVTTLVNRMQQENVGFDSVTMISILSSFCMSEDLIQGMTVHGHSIKTGFTSDVSLVNALISMYINCWNLDAAHLLFEEMPTRSMVSWNALLTGLRYNNLHEEVMTLFHRMIREGQKPNFVTLLNILPVCRDHRDGKCIHGYAVRTGEISEAPLLTSLLCMYARFQNSSSSCLLFEKANKSDITVWNAMMSVHAQSNNPKHAVHCFNEILKMQHEPDYVTILSLTSSCAQLSSLNLSQSVMAYVIRKGFENDLLIRNALVDSFSRCGYITIARKVFDEMNLKDVVSWSVMINGYGTHGNAAAALSLFSEMKCSGITPDDITFISILSACSHSGLVEQGKMLFSSMIQDYGILPRMEHYACMIDLLGRTGHLTEAYELVQRLPFAPSSSLLESLLGACTVHGNFELAEEITALLLHIEQRNSRPYVMLSNVYAATGRWSESSSVRSKMDEITLRKVPGFSLVDVDKH